MVSWTASSRATGPRSTTRSVAASRSAGVANRRARSWRSVSARRSSGSRSPSPPDTIATTPPRELRRRRALRDGRRPGRRAERRRPRVERRPCRPMTAAASSRQAASLSASDWGRCLGVAGLQGGLLGELELGPRWWLVAVRVAVVGERARGSGPRSRPGVWRSAGSAASGMPAISRIDALVGADRVGPVDEPRRPRRRVRASSNRVLYRSEAATAAAWRTRASRDSHRASAVGVVVAGADLVRDRQVGVQVGVAGAGVAVVERRRPGSRGSRSAARRGRRPGRTRSRPPARPGCWRPPRGGRPPPPAGCAADPSAHSRDADFTGVKTRS